MAVADISQQTVSSPMLHIRFDSVFFQIFEVDKIGLLPCKPKTKEDEALPKKIEGAMLAARNFERW